MSNISSEIIDQIAEIVRRLGKREEIEEEIIENVKFSALVTDLLKDAGPVRDAAAKAIVGYLKNIDVDNCDVADDILKGIDFKKLMPSLLEDADFKESIGTAIRTLIEDGNLDVTGAVEDSLDADNLKTFIGKDDIQKQISEKLVTYIEQIDIADLDGVCELIDEELFTEETVQASIKANPEEIDEIVFAKVKEYLEQDTDGYDEDHPVAVAVQESKAFTTAVEKAVEELVDAGKVDRLVEKVATAMLTDGDSTLRERLVQSVSTQLVGKIAASVVDRVIGK